MNSTRAYRHRAAGARCAGSCYMAPDRRTPPLSFCQPVCPYRPPAASRDFKPLHVLSTPAGIAAQRCAWLAARAYRCHRLNELDLAAAAAAAAPTRACMPSGRCVSQSEGSSADRGEERGQERRCWRRRRGGVRWRRRGWCRCRWARGGRGALGGSGGGHGLGI